MKKEDIVNAYKQVLKRKREETEGILFLFPKRDLKIHPLARPIKRDPVRAKKMIGQSNKITEAIIKALS